MVGMPFLTAEVFLEPMGTDVLFAPPRLRAIQARLPALNVDAAGGVMLPLPPTSRVRYLAISQPERMRDEALRRPVRTADYPPEIRNIYLQLPALSPRVRVLAESLAEGARTPIEVVRRVEAYLEKNLRYSLDLGRDAGLDPLEDFLFERKTGNCEYFAASLVVLARAAGIPARMVTGLAAIRPATLGLAFQEISREPAVSEALFEVLETQRMLASNARLALLPHAIAVADALVDVGAEHRAEHVVRDQREHAAEHDEAREERVAGEEVPVEAAEGPRAPEQAGGALEEAHQERLREGIGQRLEHLLLEPGRRRPRTS